MEAQMKFRHFLPVLLVSLIWAKGPQPSNLSVITNFASTDPSGTITDIQSDGLGAYYDGVDGIGSILTTNGYNGQIWGDWQFDDLSSTTREVSLSFANPIQPSQGGTAVPNPPFTIKSVSAHVEDKCTQISNGNGGWNNMYQMKVGQTFQCPVIVHFFDSNGYEYRIYMGPNWEPESTFGQVTCNSVATDGGCNDWYIDPIPSYDQNGNPIPGVATGRLVYFAKRTSVNEGDFYFRYHFHITRP
jgi:hypothetical protein